MESYVDCIELFEYKATHIVWVSIVHSAAIWIYFGKEKVEFVMKLIL